MVGKLIISTFGSPHFDVQLIGLPQKCAMVWKRDEEINHFSKPEPRLYLKPRNQIIVFMQVLSYYPYFMD
jgi:hypothetical protein